MVMSVLPTISGEHVYRNKRIHMLPLLQTRMIGMVLSLRKLIARRAKPRLFLAILQRYTGRSHAAVPSFKNALDTVLQARAQSLHVVLLESSLETKAALLSYRYCRAYQGYGLNVNAHGLTVIIDPLSQNYASVASGHIVVLQTIQQAMLVVDALERERRCHTAPVR